MDHVNLDIESYPQQMYGNDNFAISSDKHIGAEKLKKHSCIGLELTKDQSVIQEIKVKQLVVQNKNIYWTTKVLVITIMMCAVWLGKKYATPSIEVDRLSDPIHDTTSYLNNLVNKNHHIAMFFQISSSLIMDFSFFALCIYWVLRIDSGRVIIAMAGFYVFRGLNQALIVFPFPEGYYWEYPSFPAYVTPYGKTSDFFYSGHVGFLNLCALEWFTQKRFFMFKLTCAFNIYIAFVMLVFRIHYAVGLVVSHWLYMIVQKYQTKIDSLFRKIYNWTENYLEQKPHTNTSYEEELQINA